MRPRRSVSGRAIQCAACSGSWPSAARSCGGPRTSSPGSPRAGSTRWRSSAGRRGWPWCCSCVVLLLRWEPFGGTAWLPWAVGAGLSGLFGLVCFYTALSTGTMGVVAPIAGLGVVVPVVLGVVGGERPSTLAWVGMAVAVLGVTLASGPELASGLSPRPVLTRDGGRRRLRPHPLPPGPGGSGVHAAHPVGDARDVGIGAARRRARGPDRWGGGRARPAAAGRHRLRRPRGQRAVRRRVQPGGR